MKMRYRIASNLLPVLVFFGFVETKKMIWKFDSDISNSANWIGGKLSEGCTGIHFSTYNSAAVSIKDLVTAEITLPRDGQIVLDADGSIEFMNNKKCIKLKPFDIHYWEDPNSWSSLDINAAVPDKERIPCNDDDVEFPNLKRTHNLLSKYISLPPKMGSTSFTSRASKQTQRIDYVENRCKDPYGCLCHTEMVPCDFSQDQKKVQCVIHIVPEEFCSEICGAYVTYKPGKGPTVEEVRKKLKEYEVDTHVSRVKEYLGEEVVQVVFNEKVYSGRSVDEAESFKEYLQAAKAEGVKFFKSGPPYFDGDDSAAIVFGSLVAVLAFFGLMVYLNGDPSFMVLINRFNRDRGSIFNAPFFARFDNTDQNLIIDGQSETGSILDIAKSFDNPMFGQTSTSTTESQHENPLYEATKDVDVEE